MPVRHAADMHAARRQWLFVAAAALLALAPLSAAAAPAAPDPDIAALIARVARAREVVFIRNGGEYPAARAAAHLRRKLGAVRGRTITAEQFIDRLGTRSSLTGSAYRVRLPDGREIDSAVWLRGLLREVRAQRVSTPAPAARVGPVPSPAPR